MPWDDNLDDFERQLAADKSHSTTATRPDRAHRHRRDHSHSHHHRSHRRGEESADADLDADGHRRKRRRRSRSPDELERERDRHRDHGDRRRHRDERRHDQDSLRRRRRQDDEAEPMNGETTSSNGSPLPDSKTLKRDAWMEAPTTEVQYTHKPTMAQDPIQPGSPRARLDLKIHEAELNKHHLQELEEGRDPHADESASALDEAPATHTVDYEFGDSGARWRMTRLRNVYRQAEDTGQSVEEAALKQYGSLQAFDDAREEENELDRRERYGEGYVGRIKPSGELHQERKLEADARRAEGERHGFEGASIMDDQEELQDRAAGQEPQIHELQENKVPARTMTLDSTALNRLRAQMMKAKLKGLPEAGDLERQYEQASKATESGPQSGVVVLSTMENRMLAGGRGGEVKDVGNRRGRERGNVEENQDMSIEDMVREERRTKGLFGNEGERLAERIAKDGKFDNDLDYMDENANKLAKRVHKSETALRNSAIANHKLTSSIHASCPLCHHEDRPADPLPTAAIVSRAHRSYLTLATTPEISPYGCAVIVPTAHHANLLHCDDDEWEELRNFQKALVRMFHDRDLGVLFYENAAHPRKQRHAALVVVAVPLGLADDAPAFFREAILASDDEWTQHRKLLHTTGKGRNGFRRTLSKEMPYFHVWTEIDGGLGHVVEDDRRWPQGDLFAREVLGGMLRVKPEIWRKQGRWERGADTTARVDKFRKGWRAYDWTRVLVEDGEAL